MTRLKLLILEFAAKEEMNHPTYPTTTTKKIKVRKLKITRNIMLSS